MHLIIFQKTNIILFNQGLIRYNIHPSLLLKYSFYTSFEKYGRFYASPIVLVLITLLLIKIKNYSYFANSNFRYILSGLMSSIAGAFYPIWFNAYPIESTLRLLPIFSLGGYLSYKTIKNYNLKIFSLAVFEMVGIYILQIQMSNLGDYQSCISLLILIILIIKDGLERNAKHMELSFFYH